MSESGLTCGSGGQLFRNLGNSRLRTAEASRNFIRAFSVSVRRSQVWHSPVRSFALPSLTLSTHHGRAIAG